MYSTVNNGKSVDKPFLNLLSKLNKSFFEHILTAKPIQQRFMSNLVEVDKEKPGRRNPSRVRDHLANERTYLAWMRTAIALMGFGVVIVRLRAFHPPLAPHPGNGWKLGLLFSLIGLVTVLLSTQHYFAVRRDIDDDNYEPTDRWVILFSLAILLLGAGVIYLVFATPLDPMSSVVPE